MNTAQAIVIVAVLVVLLVGAYMFQQQQARAAALASQRDPWNQLGGGLGQIIGSVGGFMSAYGSS